jgi:hypothetical protein
MFGRQLKASIAKDNGRSDEFAGQQQCGQDGHLY